MGWELAWVEDNMCAGMHMGGFGPGGRGGAVAGFLSHPPPRPMQFTEEVIFTKQFFHTLVKK